MVLNLSRGGAAVMVFARQHGIVLQVLDAGVNSDEPPPPGIVDARIARGTRSFLREPAMSGEERDRAMNHGARRVRELHGTGCIVVGLGETGTGNTSAAALIMHRLCAIPVARCAGPGTGLGDQGPARKRAVLEAASRGHLRELSPLEVLRTFGGFEIAMICGGMTQAAALRMVVLVDGFTATAAALVAAALMEMPAERVPALLTAGHSASRLCSLGLICRMRYVRENDDAKARPLSTHVSAGSFLFACLTGSLPLAFLPPAFWPPPSGAGRGRGGRWAACSGGGSGVHRGLPGGGAAGGRGGLRSRCPGGCRARRVTFGTSRARFRATPR